MAGLDAPRLVVAQFRAPVPWGDDGAPVDTVCMLVAPSGPAHLALLGALARALLDPTLRDLLRRNAGRRALLERLEALRERRPEV
jgi:mannitol/fructose-specific phosphotransferase system IIA component (Ntr-type)